MPLLHSPTEHTVARLRRARLAASQKPFVARGGHTPRCHGCRLPPSHCICHLRPVVPTRAGICLLLGDIETLKPTNTGWLIADVVPNTWAFQWSRTQTDLALLALLADPQWQPYVVFPPEYAEPTRVVSTLGACAAEGVESENRPQRGPFLPNVQPHSTAMGQKDGESEVSLKRDRCGRFATDDSLPHRPLALGGGNGPRPLFVLLDGTWSEARKMFRKSPYLNRLPVLGLQPQTASRYRLRRSTQAHHLCTAEVAAQCLALAGDASAAHALDAWFDLFSERYLYLRSQQPVYPNSPAHQRLLGLRSDQVPQNVR